MLHYIKVNEWIVALVEMVGRGDNRQKEECSCDLVNVLFLNDQLSPRKNIKPYHSMIHFFPFSKKLRKENVYI